MKILVVSFLRNIVTPCFPPTICHNITTNTTLTLVTIHISPAERRFVSTAKAYYPQ